MKAFFRILLFPICLISLTAAALLVISGWSGYLYVSSFPVISFAGMIFTPLFFLNLAFALFWAIFHSRKAWYSIAAICLTAVPAWRLCPLNITGNPSDSSDRQISLLSYNTREYGMGDNGGSGSDEVFRFIGETGADIICLQESGGRQFADARRRDKDFLPSHKYSCSGRSELIVSRWPILQWEEVMFENSWNGALHCLILHGADTISVYDCHFQSTGLKSADIRDYSTMVEHPKDSIDYEKSIAMLRKLSHAATMRAGQAEEMAALIDADRSRYIILCGDFNDTPLSYSHRIIGRRLTDVYVKSGFGPGHTYSHEKVRYRIDHVFCSSSIIPLKSKVDKSIDRSDHYPVISYLKLQ